MLSTTTVLQQNTEIPSTEIDGEIVLMNSRSGSYCSMSGTAREIWVALAKPVTLEEICSSLTASYAVDQDTCRRDVLQFVEALAQQQLVRGAEA